MYLSLSSWELGAASNAAKPASKPVVRYEDLTEAPIAFPGLFMGYVGRVSAAVSSKNLWALSWEVRNGVHGSEQKTSGRIHLFEAGS